MLCSGGEPNERACRGARSGGAPRGEQRACGQHASLAKRAETCLNAFHWRRVERVSESGSSQWRSPSRCTASVRSAREPRETSRDLPKCLSLEASRASERVGESEGQSP